MAEFDEVDPLDSLGPDFGGINRPSPGDVKDFLPFEGDTPSLPEPNIRQSFFGPNVHKDQQVIKNNTVGKDPVYKTGDFAKSLARNWADTAQTMTDKNNYGQIYSYDAGPSGNAFYDRYAAYGDETFAKIGFTPFRDNESIFNERTSMWDDWGRMMSNSFVPLFTRGFVSGPKSLVRMMQGDLGSDPEDAEVYERASAIGQSSKGGLSAFFNNTAMNFGYTAGIIVEALAEEVGGALLAPVTGGTSFVAATANNLRKLDNLTGKATDLTTAVNQSLNAASTVGGARKLWNSARLDNVGKVVSSKVGRFINPLENVTGALKTIRRNEDNLTGLARAMSGTFKTAGAFYRDVRNVNMALAEARLEGGFVENKVYDNLYNDYYHEKGFVPDNKTQQEMLAQAKDAGMEALGWNAALIYASNKILLPNIMGPKGGIRKFLANKTREVMDMPLAGGTLSQTAQKLASGKTIKTGAWQWEKGSLKNSLKSLRRAPVGKTLTGLGSYFSVNVSEGLQENLQEAIAFANEKYYTDSFKDPALATHLYSRGAYLEGLKEQFSAQGLETFASGFFMGMFAGPLNKAVPVLSKAYNRTFDSENYKAEIKRAENYGKRVAQNLTDITANPEEFFKDRFFNYATQSRAANSKQDDEESKKNKIDDTNFAFVSNMITALDNGTVDNVVDYFSSLQELTTEEFEEALGLEKGLGAERQATIPKVLQKIDSIKSSYDKYNEMYPSPIDLSKFEEGTQEYKKAQIFTFAWNRAKQNLMWFNETYMDTAIRMKDVEEAIHKIPGFEDILQSDVQGLFEMERLDNEIGLLETEISSLQDSDTKDIKSLNANESKLAKLKLFKDKLAEFQSNFLTNEILKSGAGKEIFIDAVLEQNPDLTREEAAEAIDQQTQQDIDLEVLSGLKNAFGEYIKTLAKTSNQTMFDNNISEAFEMLVDYYKLRDENKSMSRYINVLNNPKDFYELVVKNEKWATELYENRKQYFQEMVDMATKDTQVNSLLNNLANQDIYVNEEDLTAFLENGIVPEEFFSQQNKQVIRKGHPKYNNIRNKFLELVDSWEGTTSTEEFEAELQTEIDELNKQEQAEIDALEKKPTRVDLGTITPPAGKKLNGQIISDNMQSGEYVEVTFTRKGQDEVETTVYYKDEEGNLRDRGPEGEVVKIPKRQKFESAKKYKTEMLPDSAEAQKIKDKYAELRAQAIERYRAKAEQAPSERLVKFQPIAYDTPWDELPQEVAVAIMNEAFPKYLELNPQEKEAFDQMTDEQQMDMIMNFAQNHPLAKDIIDQYNTDKKVELLKSVESKITIPKLKDDKGNPIDLSKLDIKGLRTQLARLNASIQGLQNREELTPVNQERLQEALLIRQQLEDYIAYRAATEQFPLMQEAIAKLSTLTALQSRIVRDDATHTYYLLDKNGKRLAVNFTSVTNKINELPSISEYLYAQQDKVDTAFKATLGNPKDKGTVEDFIEFFKTSNPIGFELEGAFEDLRSRLTNNSTLEEITEAVKKTAYEENRIAGNYIDDQARLFLSNKTAKFDETKITKEAFDSLFGENGYFTAIKERIDSGELYVLAEDLKLYDETLGIAGEIDLLLTDTQGRIFIVDMKTGNKRKWDAYTTQSDIATANKLKYSAQTRAYENLLYNLTGIEVTGSTILPIEIELDKGQGKIISAGAPSNKSLTDIEMGRMLPGTFIRDNAFTQEVDKIVPRKSKEEIAKMLGANTAETLDPELRRRLNSYNLTDSMINLMTEEQLEQAKEFESKADAREMVNMFLDMIFEDAGANESGTGPMDQAERQKLEELVLQRMIAEEEARKKNSDIISKKIAILTERKNKVAADAQTIRDTLGFLNDLLDSTVEGTLNDIEGMIAKVDNLEKVAQLILNTGQKKRASKILDSKANLKDQIRREFSVAQDVLNRIKELQADLEQLEEIEKDMTSQLSYYQNLLQSGEMKTLERKEIENKIKKVQRKLNTIQKLIERIRKAIRQSLGYINEYTKIWNTQFKALEQFKQDTGFRYLTQEEIQELIESTDPQDIKTLNEYAGLKAKYEELEANALQIVDDVELLEEVKEQENTRLIRLNNAAVKYQNQLRYLQELLEPTFEDLKSEPLVDVNPEAPAPENTNPSSPEAKAEKEEKIEKRIEDLLTQKDKDDLAAAGGLSLGTISLGRTPAAQTGAGAVYADLSTQIKAIQTAEDLDQASADLMFALSDQLIGIIEFEELSALLNQVENSLFSKNPEVFEISDATIENKTRFIAKQSVSLSLKSGDEVLVDRFSKDRGIVFIKRVSDGTVASVPRDKFNEFFVRKSDVKNMKDEDKTLDQESKQNKKESVNNAESFMTDFQTLENARKDIDSKSTEELESYAEELRNDLKNKLNC